MQSGSITSNRTSRCSSSMSSKSTLILAISEFVPPCQRPTTPGAHNDQKQRLQPHTNISPGFVSRGPKSRLHEHGDFGAQNRHADIDQKQNRRQPSQKTNNQQSSANDL